MVVLDRSFPFPDKELLFVVVVDEVDDDVAAERLARLDVHLDHDSVGEIDGNGDGRFEAGRKAKPDPFNL